MEKSKRGLLLLTVIALLIAALALFISYHTFTGNAVYKTIDTSTPPIIKKGGIYEGTWINEDPTKAAIEIKNTQGYGLNPDVDMQVPGRFLYAESFKRIIIEHNYLENTRGIIIEQEKEPKAKKPIIQIRYNKVKNIDGRLSDGKGGWRKEDIEKYDDGEKYPNIDVGSLYGQFVQLNGVKKIPKAVISWNEIINYAEESRVEDVISIHQSSGAGVGSKSIRIHDNYIYGAYPLNPEKDPYSGGGIMGGDNLGSGFVLVRNNLVVGTTNYGIAIATGRDITVRNNKIISSGITNNKKRIRAKNVGLYVWNQDKDPEWANNIAKNNIVGWEGEKGRNDWWLPDCVGKNCAGNKRLHNNEHTPITEVDEEQIRKEWQNKLAAQHITLGPQ